MATNLQKYKVDLERLMNDGRMLIAGLYNELNDKSLLSAVVDQEDIDFIKENKLTTFSDKYQKWYSEAYVVIEQLLVSRKEDFQKYYKIAKGEHGLSMSRYLIDRRDYDLGHSAETYFKLYQQQYLILKSVANRFDSTLYDIKQLLQADVFDSEVDCARELCNKGFYRASGAICGVVIEKHLAQVCSQHQIKITKKNPTINDYNEHLKNNDVIDIPKWRNIQRLADIRNMCDHHKHAEPNKDDIEELINGTDKIIRTIF